MQIVLTRRKTFANDLQDAESYMRIVFAHISHLIFIENIQVANIGNSTFNAQEKIIISAKPQFTTEENEQLARKVAEAISLRGDLTLEKIAISPTKHFDCIRDLGNGVYRTNLAYASFLARNNKYREESQTSPITKATAEYKQIGPDQFASTGVFATTQSGAKPGFDPTNIYNCFAVALSAEKLRNEILDDDTYEVLLKFNEQILKVEVKQDKEFTFNFSAAPKKDEEAIATATANLNISESGPRPGSR